MIPIRKLQLTNATYCLSCRTQIPSSQTCNIYLVCFPYSQPLSRSVGSLFSRASWLSCTCNYQAPNILIIESSLCLILIQVFTVPTQSTTDRLLFSCRSKWSTWKELWKVFINPTCTQESISKQDNAEGALSCGCSAPLASALHGSILHIQTPASGCPAGSH